MVSGVGIEPPNLLIKSELRGYTGGYSEARNGRLERVFGRPSLFLVSLSIGQFATNTATRILGCRFRDSPRPGSEILRWWFTDN